MALQCLQGLRGMGSLRLPVSLAILPGAENRTRVWLELGRTGCRHFPSTLGFSCSALERLTLERARTLPLMSAVLPLRLLFDGGTFSTGRLDKEKKSMFSSSRYPPSQEPWPVLLAIVGGETKNHEMRRPHSHPKPKHNIGLCRDSPRHFAKPDPHPARLGT